MVRRRADREPPTELTAGAVGIIVVGFATQTGPLHATWVAQGAAGTISLILLLLTALALLGTLAAWTTAKYSSVARAMYPRLAMTGILLFVAWLFTATALPG
ncbi:MULTISPECIES: hypothetical protein [unclassified Nonomuraea]|uniref:hypothetical protein n=1 Tax=unclassified Nonomuraea TaxID=2593643 RepID=UPI0033F7039B